MILLCPAQGPWASSLKSEIYFCHICRHEYCNWILSSVIIHLIRVLTLLCDGFLYTTESYAHKYWIFYMATGLLNFKHRSPRVLLTPLRLPSVSTLHLQGVSYKQLFRNTKVSISPLHLGSPNSKLKSISNIARTAKSFVSLIVLTEGFLKYLRAMLGDAWHATISHASQL